MSVYFLLISAGVIDKSPVVGVIVILGIAGDTIALWWRSRSIDYPRCKREMWRDEILDLRLHGLPCKLCRKTLKNTDA